MLYEVITVSRPARRGREDEGASEPGDHHRGIPVDGKPRGEDTAGGAEESHDAHGGVHGHGVHDRAGSAPRITSYNVCYTKLLRFLDRRVGAAKMKELRGRATIVEGYR